MKKKKSRAEFKIPENQLQGFLAFRKRGFVDKNGKAYTRKVKHKEQY